MDASRKENSSRVIPRVMSTAVLECQSLLNIDGKRSARYLSVRPSVRGSISSPMIKKQSPPPSMTEEDYALAFPQVPKEAIKETIGVVRKQSEDLQLMDVEVLKVLNRIAELLKNVEEDRPLTVEDMKAVGTDELELYVVNVCGDVT